MKNNRGVEDNRIRQLDYCVQINKLFYTRLIKNENITLFSPHDVKDLYTAFFSNQDEFERLYLQYEQDESIRKKVVSATELFSNLMQERASTGRIYIQNVDHSNEHSSFDTEKAPVHMTNLCVAGDTDVTIKQDGNVKNVKIKTIENEWVTIYNGEEWTEAYCEKTSDSAVLYRVRYAVAGIESSIWATAEHKWYLDDGTELRTKDLTAGMKMKGYRIVGENNAFLNAHVVVISVDQDNTRIEPTWCLHEPKLNRISLNGVITGNCVEITLPTKPFTNLEDPNGEIALCTLAAVNLGEIKDVKDLEEPTELLVRALDELLDYQNYPVKVAEDAAKGRRSLGIGVINYAYYLAKNGMNFSSDYTKNFTHQTFEAFQYYLIKASNNLAKEKGACKYFQDTKYAKGILPIDTYKKSVDEIVKEPLHLDWESLRQSVKEYGLRNSTLSAIAPTETSSQISNATNGIEPPRGLISVKQSKDGILKQVVPEYTRLKDVYQTLWQIPNTVETLQLAAIMQKFIDQSISTNTNYDPNKFPNGKVPMQALLKDLLTAYKLGIKTLYYHNTRDGADDSQNDLDDACASGACKI